MRMRWWMWGIIGIIMCGIGLLLVQWHGVIFLNLSAKIEIIKHWVAAAGIWAPLMYLLGYVLRPLVFFPSVPYSILGGMLFGGVWGTVYVLIGAMLSGVCEFLLVRYFIGGKVKKFLREKTLIINQIITKHGFITVFLVRLIPNVAFDLQNCGLAFTSIKFTHYFYGTLLGCLPACIFYASLGNLAFDWSVSWKIGLVVLLGICLYLLRVIFPSINRSNR